MINRQTISLIIPCRNEAKIIGGLIKKIPKFVDEIIVVDNNSTDNTAIIAHRFGAKVIKETRTVNGIGYGFAHQSGIKAAKGDIIVALDGDDTYPSKEIPKIIRFMDQNKYDFVSCSRLPLDHSEAISPTRRLGIQILNLETFILFGFPIKDILTGMWAFRKSVAPKLNLVEGGWDLSPEIKLSAITNPEINFTEYHIPHFCRDDSAVSKQKIWETGFNHLKYIFRYRLSHNFVTRMIKALALTPNVDLNSN